MLRLVPAVILPLATAAALLLSGCAGPVAPQDQIGRFDVSGPQRDGNVSAAANDFTMMALPQTVSVTAGGAGNSVISTIITSGAAELITLSVSGVPSGASALFSGTPNPSPAGSRTRLILNSGSAAAGTYSLTVTGTAASATHTTTVTFVINPVVVNDFSISASPSTVSVTSGGSGTSAISTTVTSGSAQSVALGASGVPTGATATFSPNPITAGGGTTLTLGSGSAAVGTYAITITGTGASATHSTTVSFVINPVAANDFSISASPSGVSVAQGGVGSSTISTAVTSGSAQTVSLFASGLPSGVSASFNPSSITAGALSTVSFTASATAAKGLTKVTITGTGTSATHGTSIGVNVTSGSACTTTTQLFSNPGFESGNTVWTATSAVIDGSTSGSAPRTVTFKAWLNGYGVAHTDNLFQTITIPSGACSATLTFWLKITTAETSTTVALDNLTVTVRNGSNTVLSTLATYSNLNKGTTYVQRTFDVSAFKGQSVRIYFNGTEDSQLQTSFFIDDTALTVIQ